MAGPSVERARQCVVVMGPSGVGKTTVAKVMAERLGWSFAEADDFHTADKIAKMAAGAPLDDDDRAPWLERIRDWISAGADAARDSVVTCSALKRRYRDVLSGARARVRFLELDADAGLVEGRLSRRTGHYMPASLLASQLAALEPLQPDEDGVIVGVAPSPNTIVDDALRALGIAAPPAGRRQASRP